MHKYFVEIFQYTPEGSLKTIPFLTKTADNELQLRAIRDQYAYQKQMTVDEDGNEIEGTMKAYKVVAHKLCYVQIENIDAEISEIFQ